MTTLELLRSPNIPITLYIYSHIMVLAFAYTAVIPVFFFTPIYLGGFGFTPFQISIFMCIGGLSQALWLLLAFPWLQARIGTKGVMKACGTAYPFFFALLPVGNIVLRHGLKVVFWTITPVGIVLGSGVSMSFTAILLVLNDVSPSPAVLGTLNALALTLASGIRAFSPGLFASLFAASVRSGVLDGHLIWVLMVAIAAGFSVAAHFTPEDKTEDGVKNSDGGTEEGDQSGA